MNNNRLIKIYLAVTAVSILLFTASYILNWFFAKSMTVIYATTLPFLAIAVGAVLALAFTPEEITPKAVRVPETRNNVIVLKACRKRNNNYYPLKKIS